MPAVHAGQIPDGLAAIDAHHAALDAARHQLAETTAALEVVLGVPPLAHQARPPRRLRIGAAAQLVGVQPAALRSWEQLGLIQPGRDASSNYRVYDERLLRRLRVIALLRQAGYDVAAISTTLAELDAGEPQRAVAVIDQRRQELAAASWRCLAAACHDYVSTWSAAPTADITPSAARPAAACDPGK